MSDCPYDLISFDLQGTLSASAFSDGFWRNVLPALYAKRHAISVDESRRRLKAFFTSTGAYDLRYYDTKHWLAKLGLTFEEIRCDLGTPHLYADTLALLKELRKRASGTKTKIILVSSTTRDFIDIELGEALACFDNVISTIDDYRIAGKPASVFTALARSYGVSASRAIHIGDHAEMDIGNARKAGWTAFRLTEGPGRDDAIVSLRRLLLRDA